MNWGKKIALVYGLFVIGMLALVFACLNQKDIFLVSDNYYAEEVAYEKVIQKKKNANELAEPVTVDFDEASKLLKIDLTTASTGATGNVFFYRPSNPKMDVSFPINVDDNGIQNIDTQKIPKGLWVVKVDWKKGEKEYYKEEKIQLY